jgi:uncharacterized SAM-binding protein YcdF (DUF218 family)
MAQLASTGWEAIVILGAAIGSNGEPSDTLLERIEVGVELWKRGLAPRVVVTGRGEAGPMAQACERRGVPRSALVEEPRARSTRENALEVARLLGRGTPVLIVTQPYHQRRALACFRRAGLVAERWRFTSRLRPSVRRELRELGAAAVYRLRGWA